MFVKKKEKINPFFVVSALILQTLIYLPLRFLLGFFGHLEVRGLENLNNLPQNKGIIFAPNHSSEIDPFLTPVSLPFLSRFMPLFYATREKSFYGESGFRQIFYGGLLFKLAGGQCVRAGLKDYEKSLANQILLLETGHNLCFFPEGKITKDGKIGEARGGIAYLAEKTGSVVIPVGIFGVHTLSLFDLIKRKRKIIVIFGTPIHKEELEKYTRDVFLSDSKNIYKIQAEYILGKVGYILDNFRR